MQVLGISVTEFCEMHDIKISELRLVGVHATSSSAYTDMKNRLQHKAPRGAVAIINFKEDSMANFWGVEKSASGDAVVLKDKM